MNTVVKPSSKRRSRINTANDHTQAVTPEGMPGLIGHRGSTVVLICITCPAITVVTVILWALDRVRGRALGWLGPGSPKSQPHQALRGVPKLATGLASKPAGCGKWLCHPRFRDGHDHCAGGGSTNAGPMFGNPVDMDKSTRWSVFISAFL